MTRIIIDDIDGAEDLDAALAAVRRAFRADPELFECHGHRFRRWRTRVDEGQEPLIELASVEPADCPPGPRPLVPCPRRGSHLRLTECWLCWSDVHRGACVEVDVLAHEAWDDAVARLLSAPLPRTRETPSSGFVHDIQLWIEEQ